MLVFLLATYPTFSEFLSNHLLPKEQGGSIFKIYNHLTFRVEVSSFTNAFGEVQNRIVGFSAIPKSIGYKNTEGNPIGYCETNQNSNEKRSQELKPGPIFFSYDVEFFKTRFFPKFLLFLF